MQKLAAAKNIKGILGWLDCKYQPGKCMTGRGWACQLNDLSEEERMALSESCSYLLGDKAEIPISTYHEAIPNPPDTDSMPVASGGQAPSQSAIIDPQALNHWCIEDALGGFEGGRDIQYLRHLLGQISLDG